MQKTLVLDLADTHKGLGNLERALDLYDRLIRCSSNTQIGLEALLGRSKTAFALLSNEERVPGNASYEEIIDALKDIENKSIVSLSPVQLEAGLEYIAYRTFPIGEPEVKIKKTKELLAFFKENFSGLEPSSSLVQLYVSFVNIELLLLENGEENLELAKTALQDLLANPSLPVSLKERALTKHQELRSSP